MLNNKHTFTYLSKIIAVIELYTENDGLKILSGSMKDRTLAISGLNITTSWFSMLIVEMDVEQQYIGEIGFLIGKTDFQQKLSWV